MPWAARRMTGCLRGQSVRAVTMRLRSTTRSLDPALCRAPRPMGICRRQGGRAKGAQSLCFAGRGCSRSIASRQQCGHTTRSSVQSLQRGRSYTATPAGAASKNEADEGGKQAAGCAELECESKARATDAVWRRGRVRVSNDAVEERVDRGADGRKVGDDAVVCSVSAISDAQTHCEPSTTRHSVR